MDDRERPGEPWRDGASQDGEEKSTPDEKAQTRVKGTWQRTQRPARSGLDRARKLGRALFGESEKFIRKATGQTKDLSKKAVATT